MTQQSPQLTDRLFQLFCEELEARHGECVTLELSILHITVLVGQLQLALRHTENRGPGAEWARDWLRGLIEKVAPDRTSAIRQVLEMGWDPFQYE